MPQIFIRPMQAHKQHMHIYIFVLVTIQVLIPISLQV